MCQTTGSEIKQGVGGREQWGGSGWVAILFTVVECPAGKIFERRLGARLADIWTKNSLDRGRSMPGASPGPQRTSVFEGE